MFKIGDFSKLSRVSIKTLRYYDEIGLLRPSQVDRFTGYRYYAAGQLARLNRILALKDLGLSLEQVRQVLDEGLPPAELRGMLRLRQAELQQQIELERAQLDRVIARLQRLEQEETMSNFKPEVILKEIPTQRVAAIRAVIPNYNAQGPLWEELGAFLQQHRLRPTGPCLTVYYDDEYKESDVDVEVCEQIEDAERSTTGSGSGRVHIHDLPACTAASLIHEGPYDTFNESYAALMGWIMGNGYQIVGPNREIYVRGMEHGASPDQYITEIQFPVAKG